MSLLKNENFKRFASGLILGFCFFGSYVHSLLLFVFILFAILFIMLFFELPTLINLPLRSFKFWLVAFLYPILPIFTLIYLTIKYRSTDFIFPLYPFIVSWVADTGAYLLGKMLGKHKICPTISPGKSWEGLFGGFISVFIFNIFILPGIKSFPFVLYLNSFLAIFLFSLLITVVAFLGDIFESKLKRRVNIKDSGILLPGHGGLFDRFDSVLFVAVFLLLIIWVNKITL
ncbi:phosphatidate cytidylyltransferase [Candidatus Dependentiae bacterium]|nr:phosphatidate cytidylyltransferase [Candidatus Dependentiae bacterium]MBU4387759.1 phosphatidate cytidylyltransferase [Candidatus Dependentiae bacterium]MCG2755880.1 phosphatidate cytidylyltransferase [Candidatus Dependentiae bacterium]